MLSDQILKLFQSENIDPTKFDHFDYAEAFEKLKQDYNSATERNPKKKKIIQQFIQKAYEKISKDDPNYRKQKINNFMQRMQMNKRIHDQKLQAMRFISQHYDQKSDQLWFYPNSRKRKTKRQIIRQKQIEYPLSASRNYRWNIQENQQEILEQIEDEKPIMEPNLSEEFIDYKY